MRTTVLILSLPHCERLKYLYEQEQQFIDSS